MEKRGGVSPPRSAGAGAPVRVKAAGAWPSSANWNWLTTCDRRAACSRSDSAAAADSSTSAAFCCVMRSISATDWFT